MPKIPQNKKRNQPERRRAVTLVHIQPSGSKEHLARAPWHKRCYPRHSNPLPHILFLSPKDTRKDQKEKKGVQGRFRAFIAQKRPDLGARIPFSGTRNCVGSCYSDRWAPALTHDQRGADTWHPRVPRDQRKAATHSPSLPRVRSRSLASMQRQRRILSHVTSHDATNGWQPCGLTHARPSTH